MTYPSNPYLKEACESEIYTLIYAPHSWLWGGGDADFKIVQRYHPVGSYDSAKWVEGIYPMFVTQYALEIVQSHLEYLLFIDPHFPGLSPAFVSSLRQSPLYQVPKKITVEIPAETACRVTYLRNQGHVNYRNADHLTIYVVEKTNASKTKETVEIDLTGCIINSVEIIGGKLVGEASPHLLLSDLSSVVSSFCSGFKNSLKYASSYINNYYETIQLINEAVVTGGGNLNAGKWHYETITWGGLWEKTVVVYDELPSGSGSYFMPAWRVTESWGVKDSINWVDYPLEKNPICIIYASNDRWNQKFPIKSDVGNLAESSTFMYKIRQTSSQLSSDITTNYSDTLKIREAKSSVGFSCEKDFYSVFSLNSKARVYPTYPLKYWKDGDLTHLESGYYHVFSKPVAFSFDENAEFVVSFYQTNHLIHEDGSKMNYISFGAYPAFPINPHETLYFKNNSFERGLPMANTVEILEIHERLKLLSDWMGVAQQPDGTIKEFPAPYHVEKTSDSTVSGLQFAAFGKNKPSDTHCASVYEVLSNRVEMSKLGTSTIKSGGLVKVFNLPQLLETMKWDFGKALGVQESGGISVPKGDNTGTVTYQSQLAMQVDSLYTLSRLTKDTNELIIQAARTQAQLQSLLAATGCQVIPQKIPFDINGKVGHTVVGVLHPRSTTILGEIGVLKANMGVLVGANLTKKQSLLNNFI